MYWLESFCLWHTSPHFLFTISNIKRYNIQYFVLFRTHLYTQPTHHIYYNRFFFFLVSILLTSSPSENKNKFQEKFIKIRCIYRYFAIHFVQKSWRFCWYSTFIFLPPPQNKIKSALASSLSERNTKAELAQHTILWLWLSDIFLFNGVIEINLNDKYKLNGFQLFYPIDEQRANIACCY